MSEFVYLFWHHEDYGPLNTVATMDRDSLPALLAAQNQKDWFERSAKEGYDVSKKLEELLLKTDEELTASGANPYNLMNGWGGIHFQVLKLQ